MTLTVDTGYVKRQIRKATKKKGTGGTQHCNTAPTRVVTGCFFKISDGLVTVMYYVQLD